MKTHINLKMKRFFALMLSILLALTTVLPYIPANATESTTSDTVQKEAYIEETNEVSNTDEEGQTVINLDDETSQESQSDTTDSDNTTVNDTDEVSVNVVEVYETTKEDEEKALKEREKREKANKEKAKGNKKTFVVEEGGRVTVSTRRPTDPTVDLTKHNWINFFELDEKIFGELTGEDEPLVVSNEDLYESIDVSFSVIQGYEFESISVTDTNTGKVTRTINEETAYGYCEEFINDGSLFNNTPFTLFDLKLEENETFTFKFQKIEDYIPLETSAVGKKYKCPDYQPVSGDTNTGTISATMLKKQNYEFLEVQNTDDESTSVAKTLFASKVGDRFRVPAKVTGFPFGLTIYKTTDYEDAVYMPTTKKQAEIIADDDGLFSKNGSPLYSFGDCWCRGNCSSPGHRHAGGPIAKYPNLGDTGWAYLEIVSYDSKTHKVTALAHFDNTAGHKNHKGANCTYEACCRQKFDTYFSWYKATKNNEALSITKEMYVYNPEKPDVDAIYIRANSKDKADDGEADIYMNELYINDPVTQRNESVYEYNYGGIEIDFYTNYTQANKARELYESPNYDRHNPNSPIYIPPSSAKGKYAFTLVTDRDGKAGKEDVKIGSYYGVERYVPIEANMTPTHRIISVVKESDFPDDFDKSNNKEYVNWADAADDGVVATFANGGNLMGYKIQKTVSETNLPSKYLEGTEFSFWTANQTTADTPVCVATVDSTGVAITPAIFRFGETITWMETKTADGFIPDTSVHIVELPHWTTEGIDDDDPTAPKWDDVVFWGYEADGVTPIYNPKYTTVPEMYTDTYEYEYRYNETFPVEGIPVPNSPYTNYINVNKAFANGDNGFDFSSLNTYTKEGAEFSFFTDLNASIPYIDNGAQVKLGPTDGNGLTQTYQFPYVEGTNTYYVKETKSSTGYKLDESVQSVNITYPLTNNQPLTQYVNFTNVPIVNRFKWLIKKADSENNGAIEGAVFKVSYYDNLENTNGEPRATWYLKSIKDKNNNEAALVKLDKEHYAAGYNQSPFYTYNGENVIPIGSLTVQEISTPKEYILDDTIHSYTLDGNDGELISGLTENDKNWGGKYDPNVHYNEPKKDGGVTIEKWDVETKKRVPQGEATLEGAEFTIYVDDDYPDPIWIQDVPGQYGTLTEVYDKDGTKHKGRWYRAGNQIVTIATDKDGIATLEHGLRYGDYRIEETEPPTGYTQYGENLNQTFKIREDGDKVTLNTATVDKHKAPMNRPIRGDLTILKIVDEKPSSSHFDNPKRLDGVEFTIYTKWEGQPEKEYCKIYTNEDGVATTKGLFPEYPDGALLYGHYIVRETDDPNDVFEVADFEVNITEDHQDPPHQFVKADGEVAAYLTINKRDIETNKKIPLKTTFQILTRDADYQNEHDIPTEEITIDDVKYKVVAMSVKYPNNEIRDQFETNELGTLTLPEVLPYGTYYIYELEAPVGYLNGEVVGEYEGLKTHLEKFEVSKENLRVKGPNDEEYDYYDLSIEMDYKDSPEMGKIHVKKKDEKTKEPVSGTVFQVFADEDIITPEGTKRATKDELVDEIVTDNKGEGESK